MHDWAADLLERLDALESVALVTILAVEGSAPREAGTRMLVSEGRTHGTIGGGNLEFQAIAQARAILRLPQGEWRVQDYPLGPLLGQCCGGRVRLLIEHVDPADRQWVDAMKACDGPRVLHTRFGEGRLERCWRAQPNAEPSGPAASWRGKPTPGQWIEEHFAPDCRPVLLCGLGHVGRAVARQLPGLPFALHAMDIREGGEEAVMLSRLEAAGADAMILIMTHDHGLDYRLVRAALRGRAAFVGLIGSETKRARFLGRLRCEGLDEAACARLVCPVGLPQVKGKQPEVIAVAIAAQLLSMRGVA